MRIAKRQGMRLTRKQGELRLLLVDDEEIRPWTAEDACLLGMPVDDQEDIQLRAGEMPDTQSPINEALNLWPRSADEDDDEPLSDEKEASV